MPKELVIAHSDLVGVDECFSHGDSSVYDQWVLMRSFDYTHLLALLLEYFFIFAIFKFL